MKEINKTGVIHDMEIADYESFLRENRIRINARLNYVLWFCVLTGPALAGGIVSGVFHGISYWTCINISLLVAALSAPIQYFASHSAGYTIETIVMFVAGNGLCKAVSGYYRDLIDDYLTIREHERRTKHQMDLLDSMAEIYDKVNLLDLEKTERRNV